MSLVMAGVLMAGGVVIIYHTVKFFFGVTFRG
jgi:hypothetical protein